MTTERKVTISEYAAKLALDVLNKTPVPGKLAASFAAVIQEFEDALKEPVDAG